MNMKQWFCDCLQDDRKKAFPILSFPVVSLLGITVSQLISDPDCQAQGMALVAQRVPSMAAVSMMDLSVEAEAFGCPVRVSPQEIPTVTGTVVSDAASAQALAVPLVGAGRTGLYVSAIEKAKKLITDRPVFAGMIGPFSLAGRLLDVNEALILCYEDPELLQAVLEKATEFLIRYATAYKQVGADGIVMAEPLAGLLSPAMTEEFSEPYVKRIFDAVRDDTFGVIYHNCGSNTVVQAQSLVRVGADAYHFGNAVNMTDVLQAMPSTVPVMGNIDPSGCFCNGTPESIANATRELLTRCGGHKNFILSSGCDIPPTTPWENIDAFFRTAEEYYAQK